MASTIQQFHNANRAVEDIHTDFASLPVAVELVPATEESVLVPGAPGHGHSGKAARAAVLAAAAKYAENNPGQVPVTSISKSSWYDANSVQETANELMIQINSDPNAFRNPATGTMLAGNNAGYNDGFRTLDGQEINATTNDATPVSFEFQSSNRATFGNRNEPMKKMRNQFHGDAPMRIVLLSAIHGRKYQRKVGMLRPIHGSWVEAPGGEETDSRGNPRGIPRGPKMTFDIEGVTAGDIKAARVRFPGVVRRPRRPSPTDAVRPAAAAAPAVAVA